MSITTALNIASTGLAVTSRSAELTAANVANALVDGYSRRELVLSTAYVTGGVQIDAIARSDTPFLTRERYLSDAQVGYQGVEADALERIETAIGEVDSPQSLSARMAALGTALVATENNPSSLSLQSQLLRAKKDVAGAFNRVSEEHMSIRADADESIASQVSRLNDAIDNIAELNADIIAVHSAGRDTATLRDQRQRAVDEIAKMVPVRVVQREREQISLFTQSGGVLLDGTPKHFEFTQTTFITTDMTLASGALSGLTRDGQTIEIGAGSGQFEGGTLSAAFAVRDVLVPAEDAKLDALAEDLVGRFESPAVDGTLAAGEAGLFTDDGLALDPLSISGLAARLSVNVAVDPSEGGEVWRLRDGINATVQGAESDNTILAAMSSVFAEERAAPAGFGVSISRSAIGFAEELAGAASYAAYSSSRTLSFDTSRRDALRENELSDIGVDTDAEMQKLLLIEQSYAANARVISVADELIQRLLEI